MTELIRRQPTVLRPARRAAQPANISLMRFAAVLRPGRVDEQSSSRVWAATARAAQERQRARHLSQINT